MTTSNLMSLPVDIPWERIAVSDDMLDKTRDNHYPPKWRSSIAIFHYEPPAEEQRFDNRVISYLKISCSVTGLQTDWSDDFDSVSDIPAYLLESADWSFHDVLKSHLYPYFPCHGALLQVSVFNSTDDASLPTILDFEPKKRELYVNATESQQQMSSSSATVSIKKGTTTTSGSETRLTASISGGYTGEKWGGNATGGITEIDKQSVQNIHMMSTDSSREKRETYSYTTNLSQMYHLLNSYHVGTNRALFLLQPRPFIAESEDISFVKGPRKLEGIQDFILIVERPVGVDSLCVKALLETAHLGVEGSYQGFLIPYSDSKIGNNADKIAGRLFEPNDSNIDPILEKIADQWNQLDVDVRKYIWTQMLFGDVGFSYTKTYDQYKKDAKALKESPISKEDWLVITSVARYIETTSFDPAQNLVVIYEKSTDYSGTLFVTGRALSNCPEMAAPAFKADPFLLYETPIRLPHELYSKHRTKIMLNGLNRLSDDIMVRMVDNATSDKRLPIGEFALGKADYIQEALSKVLKQLPHDHAYNLPLSQIDGIDQQHRGRLEEAFGAVTRKQALEIQPPVLKAVLNLDEAEFRSFLSKLIGRGPTPKVDVRRAYTEVPDLVGRIVTEAKRIAEATGFETIVRRKHSENRREWGEVLATHPPADERVPRGSMLIIEVAGVIE